MNFDGHQGDIDIVICLLNILIFSQLILRSFSLLEKMRNVGIVIRLTFKESVIELYFLAFIVDE